MPLRYQLGTFRFRFMSAPPNLAHMQVTTITRPGPRDYAVFLTGQRGSEFELETRLDLPSLAAAQAQFEDYHSASGQILPLTYADRNFRAVANEFLVLGVRPLRVKAIKAGKGGVNGRFVLTRATCDVMWRLRPITSA